MSDLTSVGDVAWVVAAGEILSARLIVDGLDRMAMGGDPRREFATLLAEALCMS